MSKRVIAVLLAALMLFAAFASAEKSNIRTYLTFRVTSRSQNPVVNVGQDLQIEVGIEGCTPTDYEWYFGGQLLTENADSRVYTIVNAQKEDAGIYTLKAYEDGTMVAMVDVNVRVTDNTALPVSGDESMPVWFAFAMVLACSIGLYLTLKRKKA